ncbi:MAG: hypothetical protein ACR2PO_18670 [Methyloligellaceae bacterium]
MTRLKVCDWTPAPGDLVLARVEAIGQHTRIELPDGRRASLFPGDEIIVCCGSRYAPDQFEAELQDGVWPTDLVAAGGLASSELSRHAKKSKPTKILPLGAVCGEDGEPLNVADFALAKLETRLPIKVVLVAGTSMNAGKTASAAALVRGLSELGYRVGAAKITGTGSGPDPWLMVDSGASAVLDFTDGGYASTFKVPAMELESMAHNLINHLANEGCQVAVLEVADGLLQPETATLLASKSFRLRVFGALFTAYDAMGAVTGAEWLRTKGYRLLGLGGQMTASQLAAREAQRATNLPTYSLSDLADGPTADAMLFGRDAYTRAS